MKKTIFILLIAGVAIVSTSLLNIKFASAALCDGVPRVPVCGNGRVETGEQCDDGNTNNADTCSNTCRTQILPVCGNGKVETGEQCDDGNRNNADTCSNTCRKQTIPVLPVCGNSKLEAGEECDDGNTNNADSCSNTCKKKTIPPAILPICGNSKVEVGEQCDDGNTNDKDTCSNKCQTQIIKEVEKIVEVPVEKIIHEEKIVKKIVYKDKHDHDKKVETKVLPKTGPSLNGLIIAIISVISAYGIIYKLKKLEK